MPELVVAHTADLDGGLLEGARRLLHDAFDGELEPSDWEHALGGVHALAVRDGAVVGHASVVQRRMLHRGAALRCGYVEGVAVRADERRAGIAGRLMDEVERVVRGAYDLGALGSSDMALGFYGARGWRPWRGPLSALTPDGPVATPEELGGVLVLPAAVELDLDAGLRCDWRDGDVW